MKCKLICMSFDGEYKTERPEFDDLDDAWEYSNDLGSKWYFYPFRFVVTASGKTIKEAPFPLDHLKGQRVARVAKCFAEFAKTEESASMDVEQYAFAVPV